MKNNLFQQVFQTFWPSYHEKHAVSSEQESAVQMIMKCRTGDLGYVMNECTSCGYHISRPCSCNNRNCPVCQKWKRDEWTTKRKEESIDGIQYYHVVCTIPHELNPLVFCNRRIMLSLFMKSAANAVLELAADPRYLGAVPGIVSVLHTWGSAMSEHYHVHMIVTGGGLDPKGCFIKLPRKNYFFPQAKVSELFRGKFLDGLQLYYQKNTLSFTGDTFRLKEESYFKLWLADIYKKGFNTYICLPQDHPEEAGISGEEQIERLGTYVSRENFHPSSIVGIESSLNDSENYDKHINTYLGLYSSCSGITDDRILEVTQGTVSFQYKNYRRGGEKSIMALEGTEFIRRFLQHVLPKRFMRIRFYGFLSNSCRKKNLHKIRVQLKMAEFILERKKMTVLERIKYLYGTDITLCPHCGKILTIYRTREVQLE